MTKDSFLAVTEMEMRLSMFGKKKEEMMVYVIMGFLEAGKTSLIRDLLTDDMFDDKAKTLILACEEGEEEYESAMLEKTKAACEYRRRGKLQWQSSREVFEKTSPGPDHY